MKKMKYEKYVCEWLLYKRKYIKESSYANYSNVIFNYIIPIIGDNYLSEINHNLLQNYIFTLFDKKLSVKTIKDSISIIKSSLKPIISEYKNKTIDFNFYFPKVPSTKMYVLNKDEQNKLIKYVLHNLNNKSIGILISLFHGIRIGELCALKWKDVDFNSNLLYISRNIQRVYIKNENISKVIISTPKTLKSKRIISINNSFINTLSKLKSDDENYILTGNNKYIEPRSYRYYFENILKEINIKHFCFHSLRHTFATNCISYGIDYKTVSEILGHTSINTTLNLYVHPRLQQKQECIDLVYKNLTK